MNDAIYDLLVTLLGFQFVGDTTNNSPTITNIDSTTSINVGDIVIGDGIVAGSTVLSKTSSSITLSNDLTDSATSITFYSHANNIFSGFQNNYSLPTNNSFAVITELETTANGLPARFYDDTIETEGFITANITNFQLDFYGQYANNTSKYVRAAFLSPIATDFLNDYNYTVYQIKEIQNLSDVMDYENYVPRFTFKFSLFNNTSIVISDLGTEAYDDNTLYLAEVQQ